MLKRLCLLTIIFAFGCTAPEQKNEPVGNSAGIRAADAVSPAAGTVAQELFTASGQDVLMETLPNGMITAIRENHTAPVVEFRIYVKTGSMFEGEYMGTGISHYFEHLIHSGTTVKRSEDESDKLLQAIGGATNAYTTNDHTCYHITTPAAYLDAALDVFADWMKNCVLAQAEVDREKGVILQEIKMGEDEPGRAMWKLFSETMYRVHPKRLPVIGFEQNFRRITRNDLLKYYTERYVPNNMIVVVVGDINAQETLEKIKKQFADFERKPLPEQILPEEPPQLSMRWAEKEMDVSAASMYMGWHTVGLTDPDMYPLDIISFVLTNGSSSRLVRKLREEQKIVYNVNSGSGTPWYGAGSFVITNVLDYQNAQKAKDSIFEELRRLQDDFVSEEELAKAKKQKIVEYVFGSQSMEDQAAGIAGNIMGTGDPDFDRKYVMEIQKVTQEDIQRVARKYFSENNLSVAILKPFGSVQEAVADTGHADGVQPSIVEKTGKVQKIELPNGIILLLKNNPEVPIVCIQSVFKGGIRFENENNNGITNFMTNMLFKGAGDMTAEQLADKLDNLGASVDTYCGNNSYGVSMEVLKTDMEKGFELFADILKNPAFPEDEIEKERKNTLKAVKQQDDDWGREVVNLFKQSFFTKHPYRMADIGNEKSITAMKRADLIEFHKNNCVANNMVLAVYGDIDAGIVKALAEKYLGNMPVNAGFKEPEIPVEPPLAENKTVIKVNQKKQTAVIVAFPGTTMNSGDKYALTIVDSITSGINFPGGRIYDALRVKNDLVYYVHATNWTGLDPGAFYVMTQTQPDKTDKVIELIFNEIDRMKKEAVSDEELETAKRTCISMEQIGNQTNKDMAMDAALNELYGFGYDYSDHYADRINAVTKEDVQRVMAKYFNNSVTAITGPEKKKE